MRSSRSSGQSLSFGSGTNNHERLKVDEHDCSVIFQTGP